MNNITYTFDELRSAFVRSAEQRLAIIMESLKALAATPAENVLLVRLHNQFHNLAGLGGAYGYDRVTILARSVELECDILLAENIQPHPADLDRWQDVHQAIRQELAIGSIAPAFLQELQQRTSEGPSILLVEDDPAQKYALTLRLEEQGMNVHAVSSVQAALAFLAGQITEGVIVDRHLPDGSGYELVECIRRLPDGADIPILMMSAFSESLDAVEAIYAGADGQFEKFADWDALLARLSELMQRYRKELIRVLLVEDDPEQAVAIRATLEEAGYLVCQCSDGQSFWVELAAFQPDVVLLDINLPDCKGYDLARFLRQQQAYVNLPVIFLTALNQVNERRKSLRLGGDDHLVKPVSPVLLLSTLATRLERTRYRKRLGSHDGLTHLLTHTSFLERAHTLLSQSPPPAASATALVLLDLDQFNAINLRYGYATGDQVLIALANFLQQRLRHTDLIGRYGGDEFALVVPNLCAEDAVRLLTRLREEFAALPQTALDGTTFHLTFSAGIAMRQTTVDFNTWQQAAFTSLIMAKAAGRNCVQLALNAQQAQA